MEMTILSLIKGLKSLLQVITDKKIIIEEGDDIFYRS
jgi:hypothetical protein